MFTSQRSRAVAVVLLALAVRTLWALLIPVAPLSDSVAYDILARNVAAGIGYAFEAGHPTAYWPVGTSAVYALLYRLFGVGYAPIVVLNVLLGGLTVLLVMTLTERWYGRRAGLWAGLCLALWPGQVMFSTVLASELLFNVGWLAGLYLAGRQDWPTALRAPAVACTLAATSLIRPLALPLPAVFAWLSLANAGWKRPQLGRRVLATGAEAVVTVLLMLLFLSPWIERNRRSFGAPVLVSTNGGANLWMGNNPASNGSYMELPPEVEHMNEVARDRLLKQEAVAYIKASPLSFVKRTAIKAVQTFDRESIGVAWNRDGIAQRFGDAALKPLKLACTLYWWAMLALGALGVACVWRRSGIVGVIGDPSFVLWIYFAALHAIIVSGDRYHFPCVPLISALAGHALATWHERRMSSATCRTDEQMNVWEQSKAPLTQSCASSTT